MIKRIPGLPAKISALVLVSVMILSACKKDKITPKPVKTASDTTRTSPINPTGPRPTVNLPDEVMFIGTQTVGGNYTIFLLDAATGQLVTSYVYPPELHSNFCKPFARKGILYDVERDKISALKMNSGDVLWTDSLDMMDTDEASIILHDDTFYGISYNHTETPAGDFVYALDATKKSDSYLWKTPLVLGGNVSNLPVYYYNETIYITDLDGSRLAALDAKTGTQKWRIDNSSDAQYSFVSLNSGIIIAGDTIIDATSGNPVATVKDPVIPPIATEATQTSSVLSYVTNDLFLVETTQTTDSLQHSFLSAIGRATGVEKWRADFGGHIIHASIPSAIDTIKSILLAWNNKLIVEEIIEKYEGRSIPYGVPILTSYTGGLSTLDIGNGLFAGFAGGESSNISGLGNDANSNIIAGNTLYGNYVPNYVTGINVYATDLSTGQLKWNSPSLSYSDIYPIFSCVYSISQDKAYTPNLNVRPVAPAGAKLGQAKIKRRF